jgi:hypothetical protein
LLADKSPTARDKISLYCRAGGTYFIGYYPNGKVRKVLAMQISEKFYRYMLEQNDYQRGKSIKTIFCSCPKNQFKA